MLEFGSPNPEPPEAEPVIERAAEGNSILAVGRPQEITSLLAFTNLPDLGADRSGLEEGLSETLNPPRVIPTSTTEEAPAENPAAVDGVRELPETRKPGILQRAFAHPEGYLARIIEAVGPVRFRVEQIQDLFIRPDRYERQAKPFVLEEVVDGQPMLFFSGVGSTAYQWKNTAVLLHRLTGSRAEAYSLPGHTGEWRDFISVTYMDWIREVIAKAEAIKERTGRLPILFGHSTGAAAVAAAVKLYAKEHGGDLLCAGVVLSGPPLKLKHYLKHELPLRHASYEQALDPDAEVWKHFSAEIPLGPGFMEDKEERKSPSARWIPVKLLVELWRIIPHAVDAVRDLPVPMLILQGAKDDLVNPASVRACFRQSECDDKEMVTLKGARHSAMFGSSKESFQREVQLWLERHRDALNEIERVQRLRDIGKIFRNRVESIRLAGAGDSDKIGDYLVRA